MQQVDERPSGAIPDTIVGNYKLDRTIGQGTYGKVKIATNMITDEKVAVKLIEKSTIHSTKQVARLQREIRFLKLLHHPHIVKVYEVVETADFIYIVMEYAAGGELFDYIVAHKRVKEKEARNFFRMVLSAVEYCHQNSVIHRDLKPENLLLDEKKVIKIIDFGFGNNFTTDGLLDTFCGSPFYAAPEMILGRKYEGPEVDMWSLGIILFALLCGHLPFDDDNMKELYKKIAAGTYSCPDYLAPSARHLIGRLITVDPKKRATLQETLAHPWVNDGYEGPPHHYIPERSTIPDPSKLSKDIVNRLTAFGYKVEEIQKAFGPTEDQSKPHPIRATYWLLVEMLQREEARAKAERKRSVDKSRASASGPSTPIEPTSASTLPAINEDGVEKPQQKQTQQEQAQQSTSSSLVPPQTQIRFGSQGLTTDSPALSVADTVASASRARSTMDVSSSSADTRSSAKSSFVAPGHTPRLEIPGTPSNGDSARNSSSERATSSKPTSAYTTMPRQGSARKTNTNSTELTSNNTTIMAIPAGSHPSKKSSVDSTNDKASNDSTGTLPKPAIHERRFSSPVASYNASRRTSASKVPTSKEDMRSVSGWFLNVATTSSKPCHDIIAEVKRVLEENQCRFGFDEHFTFTCEIDSGLLTRESSKSNIVTPSSSRPSTAGTFRTSVLGRSNGMGANNQRQSITTNASSQAFEYLSDNLSTSSFAVPTASNSGIITLGRPKTKNSIQFSIEICKVPRMKLIGLQFKRINGGVWDYKKACTKLLGEMSL
ncbi:hypothetical protein SmJEL517_g04825 [Synchytrium microbalum]|uniref:non-specific serine/threonine protein kinase n=1 Tax=Synchytrium microbalum TaxID=1806994 RepID=A0A507BXZ3_9FUNG|nr:uncharacterized protein SmJEL517_g04825 [Synchytrium microbalum]TPX31998.1 hypothetical protein SmJEL517_g04825 [Synchytrium microbalum]